MINFKQLFLKNLGMDSKEKLSKPEVACAILHTMVFSRPFISFLMRCSIPLTIFKQSESNEPIIDKKDKLYNITYIH
jgi:hypothetical protein